jgi:hypothetical protein
MFLLFDPTNAVQQDPAFLPITLEDQILQETQLRLRVHMPPTACSIAYHMPACTLLSPAATHHPVRQTIPQLDQAQIA